MTTVEAALSPETMLKLAGITYKKIVSAGEDSVLYLDDAGNPNTAWIHHDPDGPPGIRVSHERGFVDWPSLEVEALAVTIVKQSEEELPAT